ncbi:MAG: hypothetical protein ACR2RF_17625 [Geminicoccaceae bacterium]
MVFFRPVSLAAALFAGIFLALPLKAQTSATLNVSARVIEACTVIAKSKRELVKLARKLNDLSIIRRCSKGVVSRVNQKVVKSANLQPRVAVPSSAGKTSVSKKRIVRSSSSGDADVLLVTVTY